MSNKVGRLSCCCIYTAYVNKSSFCSNVFLFLIRESWDIYGQSIIATSSLLIWSKPWRLNTLLQIKLEADYGQIKPGLHSLNHSHTELCTHFHKPAYLDNVYLSPHIDWNASADQGWAVVKIYGVLSVLRDFCDSQHHYHKSADRQWCMR